VPRAAALARELSQLSGPMLNAAGTTPRDGGFIDRLQQNAERLVRIRPINEAPGDDPATVIARAEAKAAHGDLSGAVAELKLSQPRCARLRRRGSKKPKRRSPRSPRRAGLPTTRSARSARPRHERMHA
jgi:hypothetical protein